MARNVTYYVSPRTNPRDKDAPQMHFAITVLTAIATTFGVTSCMS